MIDNELERIRSLINRGDTNTAISELKKFINENISTKNIHKITAQFCEELGLFSTAIRELNLALRDAPDDVQIMDSLIEHYLERAENEKAIRLLERRIALKPPSKTAFETLVELYVYRGEEDLIKKAAELAKKGGLSDSEISQIISTKKDEDIVIDERFVEGKDYIFPDDTDIVRFLYLFGGREDVYARQWYSHTKSRGGYSPVEEPLTPRILRQHFIGDITVGVYCLRLDDTVSFMAFDVDISKKAIERIQDRQRVLALRNSLKRAVSLVFEFLDEYEIPAILEASGYKGYHIWILLKDPVPAAVAYNFGKLAQKRITSRLPLEIHLEFFPKQTKRKDLGYGNLIKLPLGIHQKSGKRSRFLKRDFSPVEKPFEYLRNITLLEKEKLFNIVTDLKEKLGELTDIKQQIHEQKEQGELQEALQEIEEIKGPAEKPFWTEADFEIDPLVSHLMNNCSVIAALKKKVDEHGVLDYPEVVVLKHTLGHFPSGLLAANYIFSRCANLSTDVNLVSVLRGNPISCPKIRSRIPKITASVNCSCKFSNINHYPTPLLHLENIGFKPKELFNAKIDDYDLEGLAKRYLRLKTLKRRIEKDLLELSNRLWERLFRLPDRKLKLEEGMLVATEKDGIKQLDWVEEKGNR